MTCHRNKPGSELERIGSQKSKVTNGDDGPGPLLPCGLKDF